MMGSRILPWGRIAAVVVLCLAPTGAGAQCAMCRSALRQPEAQKLAGALRFGIVILLVAPVGVFAVIAAAAARSRRRLERIREQAEDDKSSSRFLDTATILSTPSDAGSKCLFGSGREGSG